MRTQKLIHPATPARTLGNSTPGLLSPWTTGQILDQVTTCALAEEKKDRYESRSTRLEPFRQTGIRRIAPPVPAPHRWGATRSVCLLGFVQVLVLYRERSGEKDCGECWRLTAGAFSIQRLEGSVCGTFELCILNSRKSIESWRWGECMGDGRFDWLSGRVFPDFHSPAAGNADTPVVIVLGEVLKR